MTDQCKHCIIRGDIAACEKTECDKHEYWYVETIHARLAEVEAQNKRLAGTARMLIGCIEGTKKYPDMHDDFVEELEAARATLSKLEEE